MNVVLAAILALGVAFFPVTGNDFEKTVHFISAIGFLVVMASFALWLFTKGDEPFTDRKKIRNMIYRVSGVTILVCVILILVYSLFFDDTSVADIKPIFWLESLALWAFGIAWFIKGRTLWQDVEESD